MKLNTYLNFTDNCEEALEFYQSVLGGTITMKMRFRDAPIEMELPAGWEDKIMHSQLEIGDAMIMASDSPPMCPTSKAMGGFSVSAQLDDTADAEKIFAGLSDGGNVIMPIQETFWAKRFGMLVDKFGTPWMINCQKTEMNV